MGIHKYKCNMVIRPLIWVITIATLLITPLITTHKPPSGMTRGFRVLAGFGVQG